MIFRIPAKMIALFEAFPRIIADKMPFKGLIRRLRGNIQTHYLFADNDFWHFLLCSITLGMIGALFSYPQVFQECLAQKRLRPAFHSSW